MALPLFFSSFDDARLLIVCPFTGAYKGGVCVSVHVNLLFIGLHFGVIGNRREDIRSHFGKDGNTRTEIVYHMAS